MRKKSLLAMVAMTLLLYAADPSDACWRRGRASRWCPPCGVNCPRDHGACVAIHPPEAPIATTERMPAPQAISIQGKSYRIIPHPDKGNYPEDERDLTSVFLPPGAAGSNIPATDRFAGTARRIAKTNILSGDPKPFSSVSALLDWLPENSEMEGKIASTPTTNRVPEERHNVSVKGYIYAFKKEADNDYHVIIGDSPDTTDVLYLNTEVSGIPVAGTDQNRDDLWAVRKAFKTNFQLHSTGPASYYRPDPPVPVRITGSIFWDVDHENPPYVGPNDFKPNTPWEIHPISEIEFLSN